jgi:HSP20 family protein
LFGDFDRFFEGAGAPLFKRPEWYKNEFAWVPELEVVERDGYVTVRVDLPGLKKEEINVTVTDGFLTIEGERKHEVEEKEREWFHTERTYGRFIRTLTIPEGVTASAIVANFENGVLEITVPLPAAKVIGEPQKIAVGGAETKAETKGVKVAA